MSPQRPHRRSLIADQRIVEQRQYLTAGPSDRPTADCPTSTVAASTTVMCPGRPAVGLGGLDWRRCPTRSQLLSGEAAGVLARVRAVLNGVRAAERQQAAIQHE